MYWARHERNFGDRLSPQLVGALTGRRVAYASSRGFRKLVGLGSLAESLRSGDIVWGTGSFDPTPWEASKMRVLATRGPLTARSGGLSVDPVYGDPGLLISRFIPRPNRTQARSILAIPHYSESHSISAQIRRLRDRDGVDIAIVDIQDPDTARIASTIAESRLVLSSSLHGIVAAEALGVPAVWMTPGKSVRGGKFKFQDYYLGTGREPSNPIDWRDAADLSQEVHNVVDLESTKQRLERVLIEWLAEQ